MTSSESTGAEPAWTRGQAAARRKALTDAGMERPVAETLVDLLDEQAAPTMTRAEADTRFAAMLERQDMAKAEADARFAAMLDRHDAQRAQDRAEFRCEMETRFAEFRGHMDARFGSVEGRLASVEGQIAGLAGQVGMLKWTFGSFMALITLLLGVLGYTMASAAS